MASTCHIGKVHLYSSKCQLCNL